MAMAGRPIDTVDGGSVKRAREQIGAGLLHVQPTGSDQHQTRAFTRSAPPHPIEDPSSPPQWQSRGFTKSQEFTEQDILQMVQPPAAQAPSHPSSKGELLGDFKFPEISPPQKVIPSSRRHRDFVPPSSRRAGPAYYTPRPIVSPIVEEIPLSSTKSTYSRASSGVLGYDPQLADIEQEPEQSNQPENQVITPHEDTTFIRQASVGKKAKPTLTTIRHSGTDQLSQRTQHNPKTDTRAATINALTAAVAAGIGHHQLPQDQQSRPQGQNHLRMPFESSPPLSPIAAEGSSPPRPSEPISRSRSPLLTPKSGRSRKSAELLQAASPGLSDKIPLERRPGDIDVDAPEESRASTTSLADLIRRATKLASNLDRGKTASRLGMLDMFYGGEKLYNSKEKRGSGISAMLGAFPDPATPRQNPEKWPEEGVRMSQLPPLDGSTFNTTKKSGRRCCGLPLFYFILFIALVVILIAAAVLIPLFLIVIPRQHRNPGPNLATCEKTWSCQNNAVPSVVRNSCACICVDGFTGQHCDIAGDADCITSTLSSDLKNASMGSSIPRLLADSATNFSVPLTASTVLGLFSLNNLNCGAENALVEFSPSQQNGRRFYPMPQVDQNLDDSNAKERSIGQPEPRLNVRAAASTVGTSNGIVYAPSTSVSGEVTATTVVPAATSGTATGSNPPSVTSVSQRQLDFAKVVVLYVLEQNGTSSVAVYAHQQLQSYLLTGASGIVQVGFGALDLSADFSHERIIWGNGTVVEA